MYFWDYRRNITAINPIRSTERISNRAMKVSPTFLSHFANLPDAISNAIRFSSSRTYRANKAGSRRVDHGGSSGRRAEGARGKARKMKIDGPLLTRARRDLLRRRSLYVYPRNSFDAGALGRIAPALSLKPSKMLLTPAARHTLRSRVKSSLPRR